MAEITPMSERNRHEVRSFFVPDWPEVILYVLLAMIVTLIYNAGSIISKLSHNGISSPQNLKANFSNLSSGFSTSFSSALGGRLGQILLWACVGAIVYLGLWLARNVLNSFENDIISSHYLHPSSYSGVRSLGASLSIKLFLAAEVIITIAYVFVMVTAALPAIAAMAGSAAYHFGPTSVMYMIIAILATALILYIGVVLFRLMAHMWKLL